MARTKSVLRTLLTLITLVLAALTLVSGLVLLQAQRDERRRVDMIVVFAPTTPTTAHLDHAFELYRRGYAPRIVLAGGDGDAAHAVLLERGMDDTALLVVERGSSATTTMRNVADMAYQNQWERVLLVALPGEMLLDLKLARDMGLDAYAAPLPGATLDTQGVFTGSLRYWRYILTGTP